MPEKIKTFADIEEALNRNTITLSVARSYGLDRIKNLLRQLDDPQNKIKVIHIAGTSGKTSTSYYIAELLRQSGYKTGLSASPHIEHVNERLQVNVVPLEEKKFCGELSVFINMLDGLNIKPTYFEFFTAFAFWYFAKIKVDYAVMETGLGGLYDATNVVNRPDKICVITDIGLDHTDILGKTIKNIALQKAGIIQPGNIVFINRQPRTIINIIKAFAKTKGAKLITVQNIDQAANLPLIQKRNWSLAKEVAEYIFKNDGKKNLNKEKLENASSIIIPGRLEKYRIGGKEIILDGAHNEQKMRALTASLKNKINGEKLCVVLAIGANKKQHVLQMTKLVSSVAGEIIITSFKAEQDFKQNSLDPSYLAQYFPHSQVKKTVEVDQAFKLAMQSVYPKVLVTGSLYLIGKVKKIID